MVSRPVLTRLVHGTAALGAALVLIGAAAFPRPMAPAVTVSAQQPPAGAPAASAPPVQDEFVGPFASWLDVRTAGARGDGAADDTAALQAALDRLNAEGAPRVVYLPSGTYRITRTLTLGHVEGASVLGEDPDRTTLVWDGPDGGTMLLINGLAYSRIGRLTFDGRRRAAIAVDQAWDNKAPFFDTGNEYADDRFVDVDYGIRGGVLDYGFAETSVMRARFIRNRVAGISLGNFNALDLWVWWSLFEDCGVGITNEPGAGNYRVYGSVFRRSKTADLFMQNTGGFTARGNYSIGSRAFWLSGTAINHPSTVDIQDNTILDPQEPLAIRIANQGPGLMLDNRIRSLPNTSGPVATWTSLFGSDLVSVGNTYTVSGAAHANGRLITLDDRIVTRDAIDATEPVLPTAWPRMPRRVYDVPPGADAETIQRAIDAAVRDGGERPVVHLPSGVYPIDRTLVVPASTVQIVGDGKWTKLEWRGTAEQPLLRLLPPSRATLREFRVMGVRAGDGILVTGVDQPGSRVYFEGAQMNGGGESNIVLQATGAARLQFVDIGHGGSLGPSLEAEGPGRVIIESGASCCAKSMYSVSRGASVVVRDIWYEGNADDGFARVFDRGRLTMQGTRVATPKDWTPPSFVVDTTADRFALFTTAFDDRIVVMGDTGRASILGLANLRAESAMPGFTNSSRAPASTLMLAMRHRVSGGLLPRNSAPTPDVGTLDPAFLRSMLEEVRHQPLPSFAPVPEGASDVRLFRVWGENSRVNVRLTGAR